MARGLTACARLSVASSADAEVIAFELNVEASRRGILPRGLPELHFTHGRFALWSVDDLRRALRIDTAPPPPPHTDGVRDEAVLAALAAAVNRAFVGGRDAGVLAPWVTTVVCGASVRVEGPSSAPCGALDGPCARGRHVSSGDCCSVELAPTGALCAEGVCSPSGACVDPSEVPESARVRGPLSWLELMTDGLPHAWHDAAGQVQVSVLPVALPGDGSGGDGEPPSWETWESGFGGALGAPAFRMDAAVAAASRRVAFGRTGEAAPLASAGVDALGARALYVEGAPTRVCVVSGQRIDDLGPVMNDCSTGGVPLACPGEAGELRCAHEGGFAVISGDDLALAFEMQDAEDEDAPVPLDFPFQDVIPLDFHGVLCLSRECQRIYSGRRGLPAGGLRPGGAAPCEVAPGCGGREVCFDTAPPPGGTTGRRVCVCASGAEVCNGLDDDCDGIVDENASARCDDGVACTVDRCTAEGTCAHGSAAENEQLCRPAFCVRGVCNGVTPPNFPAGLRPDPNPPDANGCQYFFDDTFCEDVWDRCECNGQSRCDPPLAFFEPQPGQPSVPPGRSAAAIVGCTERFFWPTGWPCEFSGGGDQNTCTREMCCEPNDACRYVRLGVQTPTWGTTTILPRTSQICSQQLATEVRTGNTGQTASCVRLNLAASAADRTAQYANDSNPCTTDTCLDNPPLRQFGVVANTPVANGTRPTPTTISFGGSNVELDPGCPAGFQREVEDRFMLGCGQYQCQSGACTAQPLEMAGGTTPRCEGTAGRDHCLERECNAVGFCIENPVRTRCPETDGLTCTLPLCSLVGECSDGNLTPGFCLISGSFCAENGAFDDEDACNYCDTSQSTSTWTRRDPDEFPECDFF